MNKHRQRWIIFIVGLLAGLILLGYSLAQINNRATDGEQDLDYLCAKRAKVKERIAAASQFLLRHPDGVKGISGEAMEQYLADQEQNLEILNTYLMCEGR